MYGKFKPIHCINFQRIYKVNMSAATIPRSSGIYSTLTVFAT